MKRILLLLSVAFLASCTSQQEPKTETSVNTGVSVDSVPEVGEGTLVLEPEEFKLELGEAEGGGYRSQEIAQLFRQATNAYDNGDFAAGIELFKQIAAKEPNDSRAYYNLGIGYFRLDKFADAIKAFTEAIKISPEDYLSFQYRGRVYYMMGNYKNCLYDYSRVVKLNPNDPISYYNRGLAKGRVHDYLGAVEDFDKAIELDPEYAEAYFNRGLANFYRGSLHESCYDWRKAHSLGHYEAEKAIKAYCEGGGE